MKKEEQQSGASFRQKPEASEAEFATTLCTLKTEQCNKSEVRQQRGSVSERTRKRILIVEHRIDG